MVVQLVLETLTLGWQSFQGHWKEKLNVCSIISGNRNFEGRIHPLIKSNFLASPPLVIIYALSGRINIDLNNEEIGISKGKKIFLKDLWPSSKEVKLLARKF